MKKINPATEHYQRLRLLSCEDLWTEEVPAFDRGSPAERVRNVAVVRAVGVVFAESGTDAQKEGARQWLLGLLEDPEEKVRRYAMNALPKIGASVPEEERLLLLLKKTGSSREKKFVGRVLEKIGGAATLAGSGLDSQKVRANVMRAENPGAFRLNAVLADAAGLRIHLHCRTGLENILEAEIHAFIKSGAKFHYAGQRPGCLSIQPTGPFKLADLYQLRCFAFLSLVLGTAKGAKDEIEALAAVIAAPRSQRILETFTVGPVRYRLEFISRGHQRAAIRDLAARIFSRCPALLNDSRHALWQINIVDHAREASVELTPRLRPDPRFAYRQGDVPAASHPPLAAAMARLAGCVGNEMIWDPFCGSGLELIERTLLGGVGRVFGTDLSADAVAVTRENFAAAVADPPETTFAACDFRDHATVAGLANISLVISNPPMGRRVPIPNLSGLIADFLAAAHAVLRPGGRLVFANPVPVKPAGGTLRLESRRKIDLGGFHVHLEKYVKPGKMS